MDEKFVSTADYRLEYRSDSGMLIGSIAAVAMATSNPAETRVLYVADVHDWNGDHADTGLYDPIQLGVYYDAEQAKDEIASRSDQHKRNRGH